MADYSRSLLNDKVRLDGEPEVLHAIDIKKASPWILLATILGSSMAFIDNSVVNVALPRLQADLNATATQVQWVVEAYALFLSALILVGGSLSDSFGRKRIFAIGIALFAVASIGCGLSQNISQLIATRALQGIGSALLTPGSLSIIRATFPAEQRGRAIGMLSPRLLWTVSAWLCGLELVSRSRAHYALSYWLKGSPLQRANNPL